VGKLKKEHAPHETTSWGPQAFAAFGALAESAEGLSPSAEGKMRNENKNGTGLGLRWAALVWILYSTSRSSLARGWVEVH